LHPAVARTRGKPQMPEKGADTAYGPADKVLRLHEITMSTPRTLNAKP
jgi:hypothetical protein